MKLKNKHGFTLIELLAVIVVLAIIALIATPIVMKTIKNAKKGAAERSADSYIKQVETAVATSKLDGEDVPDGTYEIDGEGNLTVPSLKDGKLKIEMSGNKPKSGSVTITNGQVTSTSEMDMGDYKVSYDKENNKYETTEKSSTTPDTPTVKTYTNGEVVYFNVTTGVKCSSSDYTETQSNTGVKEGCMKFYAFNDDGKDTINLLLDHNTTATIAWNSNTSNSDGPSEVLTQLKNDTEPWQGTITPTNYTMNQTGQESNAKYTIDYSGYKARLITAQEIAKITGNNSWDEKTANSWYYFDTNTMNASDICKKGNTTGCQYGWLYDRISKNCTEYGCLSNTDQEFLNRYWTASSGADNSYLAWTVYSRGSVDCNMVDESLNSGLRPVIEVLKSNLN